MIDSPVRGTSETVARAQREAATIVEHIEQLVLEPAVRALLVVIDVQHLAEHAHMVGDVPAGAEVDLEAGVDERRLCSERAGILVLTKARQIFVAPVQGSADLEAVLVVEADEVGRLGQTGLCQMALQDGRYYESHAGGRQRTCLPAAE